MKSLKFQTKVMALAIACVVFTAAVLAVFNEWQSQAFGSKADQTVYDLSDANLNQVATDVYNLVKAHDEVLQLQLHSNSQTAQYVLNQAGKVTLSNEAVQWNAVNQLTKDAKPISLPKLLVGSAWLGINKNPTVASTIVDQVAKLTGDTVTIFQRMDAEGNLLRVSTNVLGADGQRAIGTYIPIHNVDGSSNAVASAILQGKSYQGPAFVVNAWYAADYEPILDDSNQVIGAIYVGVKRENVASLRSAIQGIQVGKTGYVFVLGSQGDQLGQYVISKGGARDGENILNSKDTNGNLFIQEIIQKAVQLKPGEFATEKYPWQNQGETQPRTKVARLVYYQPWGWVIGVSAYDDELAVIHGDLDALLKQQRITVLVASLGMSLLVCLVSWLFARSMVKPLKRISQIAGAIATGDLDHEIDYRSKDEIGILADGFRGMVAYLQSMVGAATRIAEGDLTQDVILASGKDGLGMAFRQMILQLREMVRKIEENAASLGSASSLLVETADQAGQATNQISVTIQQVAFGTNQQSGSITETAAFMEEMSKTIDRVAKGVQEQNQAVGKAAEITQQISAVIKQVSDNAQAGAAGSGKAAEVAQGGAETVNASIRGMESIQTKVNLSAKKVQEMGIRSQQIGVIVETIEDIASQTNLLALNAAIEAARAGEHGKGFAVVADEVRKLAERASSSTKEIGALVKGIQVTVTEAVNAMDEGSNEVRRGVDQANQAGTALGEILKAANDVRRQVSEIAGAAMKMNGLSQDLVRATHSVSMVVEENTAAAEEMSASASEVTRAIEDIASVSEENSAAVEEVSASAEEMNAQVEEVSGSAQALAAMAERLQQVVSQFKVADQEVERASEMQSRKPALTSGKPVAVRGNGHLSSGSQTKRSL
jgi:methyl-accepting chemotaxis protein